MPPGRPLIHSARPLAAVPVAPTSKLAETLTVTLAVTLAVALAVAPAAAQLPRLSLEATIGCEACGGPAEFGTLLDVVVDAEGGVLVITNGAPFARRFDRSGTLHWSSGNEGSGPGEYRRAMWGVLAPTGVQLVDMSARRVSRLDAAGRFRSSATFRGFPAAVAAQGTTGAFVILTDDFRGGYRLERWTAADSGQPHFALPPAEPRPPGAIVFTALAVANDGTVALVRDINDYRIQVIGADGTVRRTLVRELPRVRRTPEELAAQERVRQRAAARVAAERGTPPTGASPPRPRPAGDPDLKPHIAIDGMQFDDEGRLWVRTMRGDHNRTVFDLFAPGGAFLGEVRIDGQAGSFALAGRWLAVAAETEEGYPVVRIYRVD